MCKHICMYKHVYIYIKICLYIIYTYNIYIYIYIIYIYICNRNIEKLQCTTRSFMLCNHQAILSF